MPIQQHPLPQDISSYRFRLIGDMTIKQFGMLAAGGILGVVCYILPLPFFFKYPLTFIFIALGVGSAFVPVQGRPLDQWLLAFIKSIYSPTQYTWKQSNIDDKTSPAPASPTPLTQPVVTPTPVNSQTSSAPSNTNSQSLIPPVAPTPAPVVTTTTSAPQAPNPSPTPVPVVQPSASPQLVTPISKPTTPTNTPASSPSTNTAITPPAPTPSQTTPTTNAQSVTTSLPIPFTPTTPNTLVGLTIDPQGHILDSVLVEIQSRGLTLRATKSNKLGQFLFARPLESGTYQIASEKAGHTFPIYSIELKNEIVKPLKIQAES